jgi:hypothetical protein
MKSVESDCWGSLEKDAFVDLYLCSNLPTSSCRLADFSVFRAKMPLTVTFRAPYPDPDAVTYAYAGFALTAAGQQDSQLGRISAARVQLRDHREQRSYTVSVVGFSTRHDASGGYEAGDRTGFLTPYTDSVGSDAELSYPDESWSHGASDR